MKDLKEFKQEASSGRRKLLLLSIAVWIFSLGSLGGGITLIVFGAMANAVGNKIWMIILGSFLSVIGIVLGVFAVSMLFTSVSMIKHLKGSSKDGNNAGGVVNAILCPKCGEDLHGMVYCAKCGTYIDGTRKCKCGKINEPDAQYCVSCGRRFE